ncbi:MAG: aminoglycoside 3'-phosphotransferase [Bacillota bacterium]|nr:aminoglycoside 3'-phosphotransferase [Bacillota bacterium]
MSGIPDSSTSELQDELLELPPEIQGLLPATGGYRLDRVGRTGSVIRLYETVVLKVQVADEQSRREHELLAWLDGRLPVPKVLGWAEEDGLFYLLESRIPGRMLAASEVMDDSPYLLARLAEAFRLLDGVGAEACPLDAGTAVKLAEARRRVEAGLVSGDRVDAKTIGPGGFQSPEALLDWLERKQPPYEPAFVHGDCCLPNILALGESVSGFIDLGRGGRGDRWLDVGLCMRSLRYNHGNRGGLTELETRFYQELGLEPDPERVRYYILLDELF